MAFSCDVEEEIWNCFSFWRTSIEGQVNEQFTMSYLPRGNWREYCFPFQVSAVFKATWKNVIHNNSYKSKAVPSSQKTPIHSSRETLHKRCENMGFHWSVFSRIGRIRVIENPYFRIFYVVRVQKFETPKNLESEFILNKANTHKTTINTSWNGYQTMLTILILLQRHVRC